jgi:NAD(P)-dependent dehydrogenase (short-subunit alcohol dehydrogenase family)
MMARFATGVASAAFAATIVALLLASPASSYMTGAVIPIDGGTAVI